MTDPYIGEIRMVGFNWAPRDWIACTGSLLAIAQFTAVFSIVGTTYGGDGRTTFGVPNLQARAPLGPGQSPGLTQRRLGEIGGAVGVEAQLPGHTHAPNSRHAAVDKGTTDATNAYVSRRFSSAGPILWFATPPGAGQATMASEALSTTGGAQAHENRQPFLALNFIMNLAGLFPPRS